MGLKLGLKTLGEEHGPRMKVYENRVLKGIFERKICEGTGGWRKLHN
jgi:hypothetical protein